MDLNTEIRKLNPKDLYNLVRILEYDESWKKLMAIIPKTLTLENYDCKLSSRNLPKYNTDHFKLIDLAGYKQKRACAEILLEEWGTSGRIRPRLGHLITLLKKSELLRAADFVAVELLKMAEVERPINGPAAKVPIPDDDILRNYIPKNESINYPSSLLLGNAISSSIFNEIIQPSTVRPPHVIPKIIINAVDDNLDINNRKPLDFANEKKIENRVRFQDFPEDLPVSNDDNVTIVSNENIPAISALLDYENNEISSRNIQNNEIFENSANIVPDFSAILQPDLSNSNISNISETGTNCNYMPNFSNILKSNSNESINAIDLRNKNSSNIPAFSQILHSRDLPNNNLNENNNAIDLQNDNSNIPAFSQILHSRDLSNNTNEEIPHFSELLVISNNIQKSDSLESNDLPNLNDLLPNPSSIGTNSTRTCGSPLPNLTLNTLLPHFTYHQLEICTKNFDEVTLNSKNSSELHLHEGVGRKLGSGAFGTVYLGLGLLEKPVAVKKLNLNGVNVVNVDDTITKQFRNEVELLCKYKHENLLSLLGYSCDGPTYCLIYEYICGGALKDRLQSSLQSPEQFRLLWTDRLYIALGTAKAVSYLHTTYSMPLIHRDIKTANILLDNANKPKLCDFGLIKLTPNTNTNTGTTVFGTSAYMAPEAFRGDVSVKLDTFSFGVVLLELLTSLPPLDENREGNDLVTHIDEVVVDNDIKPLLDINAGSWQLDSTHFGEELYQIAMQCLEEKKKRPIMPEVVKKVSQLIGKAQS